jgi:hypothetical protein
MAFLTIDGLTIPVEPGSDKIVIEEIGSRGRAANGGAMLGVRARKKGFEITTAPMAEADAEALAALLNAEGSYFPFDGSPNSSAGYVPPTASNLLYLSGETAYDAPTTGGRRMVDDVPCGHRLGARSLVVPKPVTNLLSVDSASFDATVGTAVAVDGAAVSRSGVRSIDPGSGRLLVAPSAVANGVRGGVVVTTAAGVAAGNTAHMASLYARAAEAGATVEVYLRDETNGLESEHTIVALQDRWMRIGLLIPLVTGPLATQLALYVVESVADAGLDFWVDQLQIEAGGVAGHFVKPAYGGPDGELALVDATRSFLSADAWDRAWSINLWARTLPAPGATAVLLYATPLMDGASSLTLKWTAAGAFVATLASGLSVTLSTWQFFYAPWWHMLTLVAYVNDDGSWTITLYADGIFAASSTLTDGQTFPGLCSLTNLHVGSQAAGVSPFPNPIDSLLFVPCRLTQRWISALYNSGAGAVFGAWPRHRVTGDVIGGRAALDMFAQVKSLEPVAEYHDPATGALVNNARQLVVALSEV